MPTKPHTLLLPLATPADAAHKRMPPVLQSPVSRGADGGSANLIEGVTVLATYELAGVSRSAEAPESRAEDLGQALLALEAEDGGTVFIRADRLDEDLRRLYPEALTAEGEIDFALFRDRGEQSRGGAGTWIWKRLSVLRLDQDAILDQALAQARDWLGNELADKLADKLEGKAIYSASWLGAKALMQAIESHLAGEPGLYRWQGGALSQTDLCRKDDARFAGWDSQPGLLFIHGTGSNTVGGFGDLGHGADWDALQRTFGERVFGFEHRTFSESPIDNALALARVLPNNARICLVTHSRGGLVGDLLCLGGFTPETRRLIGEYRRVPRPDEEEAEDKDPGLRVLREKVAAEEQHKLSELVDLLETKALRIERYVRVASPAAGTALLSDNLEVFMSGLLTLVRTLTAWGAGAAVGAVATPLAGKVAKEAVDQVLKLLSRVVLEIADKRLQPQLVPGIEAMLPEAPIGAFLARAPRRQGVQMAVIAGDIEGGGLFKRIGVMFTDWMLFDRADNDLVVDTASMYAGLAAGNGARALFDQGPAVNHFSYFKNPRTRAALREWLLEAQPASLAGWSEVPAPGARARALLSRGAAETPKDNTRPVVVFLPGIMGSHLEIGRKQADVAGSGDRVWMDFIDLPRGGLKKVERNAQGVVAEDLLDLAYGALARHLEDSHRVIRFPYDWRMEIGAAAADLAKVVRKALREHPDQPLRLLAHSMGGLVVRAMIAAEPGLWKEIVKRPGGRLLMLGTPNHGSHLFVETLLGKSDTIRMLGRIDLGHRLQGVLDIVAGFPGALQLLPQPGFTDTAGAAAKDYFKPATWPELAQNNNDFWFGKKLGGTPAEADLKAAAAFWALVGDHQGAAKPIEPVDRVAYVYGQADNTPCGIKVSKSGIEMLGTPHGDGSVTWASGRLDWLPENRCWSMPVDHMGLTSTGAYFDDIVELLATGSATRLGRLPVSRGATAAPVRPYQPGPMPGYPSEAELVTRLVGGHSRTPMPRSVRQSLAVGVRAMDLRFLRIPVMSGHYLGDPISGPEAIIDEHLVGRALSQRQRLGVHAGAIGTASVVLMPRSREDSLRGTGRGALVVGLGEMGELSSREISESVRAGVLRLLLHADDRTKEENAAMPSDRRGEDTSLKLELASLLIGFNSTINISLEESVKAITLGVLEANSQFSQGQAALAPESRKRNARAPAQVARLEFVEMYRDAAITAAHAVRGLPRILARELKRLDLRIAPDTELNYGKGMRPRLSLLPSSSYWPRMMVSDADSLAIQCAAECYEIRTFNPIPPETVRQLLALHGCAGAAGGGAQPITGQAQPTPLRYAQRLKFVYLGQRARAETVVQQRQPGLVESLVQDVVRGTRYTPDCGIGNTLFQLLVPQDFKAAAREASNLLLVLDATTANIPWEMLVADGAPLVLSTRLVRQFMSPRYRLQTRCTRDLTALLVVNPNTRGYHAQFGDPNRPAKVKPNGEKVEDRLPELPGSVAEAGAVRAVLESTGYRITESPSGAEAGDVFGKLFARPYRIMMISAHGVHQVQARDGSWRSGAVLSDGLLLSAAEVGLMEVVPELVFLNCCHLGKMDASDSSAANSHRLAYSLARELVEMGVRCVVAAGWEVEDAAGRTFAETFFTQMARLGAPFGRAIHEARKQTFDLHPGINTWGAYQAYGDPDFRLEIVAGQSDDDNSLLAPDELLDWLERRRVDASRVQDDKTPEQRFRDLERDLRQRLHEVPAAWLDRPDIQQALGLLYAEHAEPGFERARAALTRAIAEEAKNGVVALTSIEQLANFEAHQAERMGKEAGKEAGKKKAALKLVDSAVTRLRELIRITRPEPDPADATGAPPFAPQPNAERQALLGSALKRKAVLMIANGEDWAAVTPILGDARDAYRVGEGCPDAAGFNPYAMVNRLQLDALLDLREPALETLIAQCQAASRRRFADGYDFFDGVMAADAELIQLLYPGAEPAALGSMSQRYPEAVRELSSSARQLDSMVAHLCLLATLVQARGGKDDALRAQALADLMHQLDPNAAPCNFGPEPVAAVTPADSDAAQPAEKAAVAGKRKRGKKP